MSASSPRRKTKRKSEATATKHVASEDLSDEVSSRSVVAARGNDDGIVQVDDGRASSISDPADAWARAIAEEKPVRYIIQNLERAYGVPVNRREAGRTDPLDVLVQIILSQATSDTNSERTFAALKKRFPTWDAALRAREQTLADTIRSGGLANQKAAVIRGVLKQIKTERDTFDLSFLHDAPIDEAVAYLSQFRGIGPKTVACTLLFACHQNVFPLDTHIFRILRRVGLIPPKCTDARAHQIMNRLVPPGKFYSFHVNLIRHGRKLCRPREPLCGQCPVVEYCDYGQTLI